MLDILLPDPKILVRGPDIHRAPSSSSPSREEHMNPMRLRHRYSPWGVARKPPRSPFKRRIVWNEKDRR
jgi:hypothetical protein